MLILTLGLSLFTMNPDLALAADEAEPSKSSCEYYQSLETRLGCGPEGYLQKWALPMCQMYMKKAPQLSPSLQAWFPEVRYCLQAQLQAAEPSCESLNEIAIESHVSCYLQTGFCQLPKTDQWKLMELTNLKLFDPLWMETSARIAWACSTTMHSPFESDFGADWSHE